MHLEQKFFNMAVDERDINHLSKFDDVQSRAALAMAGGIGLANTPGAASRDDFIQAGLAYLDWFGDRADEAVKAAVIDNLGNEKPDKDLITAIRELKRQASGVLLGEYFLLLAADWDERNNN